MIADSSYSDYSEPCGFDIPVQPDRCTRSLEAYLSSVSRELVRRKCTIRECRVHIPGPQEALCASVEFTVPGSVRAVRAGWHEELGWWAEPCGPTTRRYLLTSLVPTYPEVADFLTHSGELGSVAPTLHRYRLCADNPDLGERLAHPAGGVRG